MSDFERIVRNFFAAYAKPMNDALTDPEALDVAAMRYFLQIRGQEPKSFAWITPDEEKALKEAGFTD